MPKVCVVLIKCENETWLMLDPANTNIAAWENQVDAARYFEDGYESGHRRGYEASMSASMHWMFFHPSIVEVDGLEDIKNRILHESDTTVYTHYSVAGRMKLAKTRSGADDLWEAGIKPRLIHDR